MTKLIEFDSLDVLIRKCGDRALTIVASGNFFGLQEYVESTVWRIKHLNQTEPATVRSAYGGPLEWVVIELSAESRDDSLKGLVPGEISAQYMREAPTNKIIIVTNRWGNISLPGLINGLTSKEHNRYVHQVYIDYKDPLKAFLAEEASSADYQALSEFRKLWPDIRTYGHSFGEVFRDNSVTNDRVRKLALGQNLELLGTKISQVKKAIELQDFTKLVQLYADLRKQLLKKQKVLEAWVGSTDGIMEEMDHLEESQREVWRFWGSRESHSSVIPKLFQLVDQTNALVQALESAEQAAKEKVTLAKDKALGKDRDQARETIQAGLDALDLVADKGKAIHNFAKTTTTGMKLSEARDSELLIGETWNRIENPEQCGHIITLDVKRFVNRTSDKSKQEADRALLYVSREKRTLKDLLLHT